MQKPIKTSKSLDFEPFQGQADHHLLHIEVPDVAEDELLALEEDTADADDEAEMEVEE